MNTRSLSHISPVDIVIVGHIAIDLTDTGERLGGSVLYCALTAIAHGLRVGIVTSFTGELPDELAQGATIVNVAAKKNTVFENKYHQGKRTQRIISTAGKIELDQIPEAWRRAALIHLAPIANEIDIDALGLLKPGILCATPQGWFRRWDNEGVVSFIDRSQELGAVLEKSLCVFSDEDLGHNESAFDEFSHRCRMLILTEGDQGSRVYWNGDVRRFSTRPVVEVDPTGAGDVFATSFFIRLRETRDPWEASRYANQVAAYSVTRPGVKGIPTRQEIKLSEVEILH